MMMTRKTARIQRDGRSLVAVELVGGNEIEVAREPRLARVGSFIDRMFDAGYNVELAAEVEVLL